MPHPSGSAQCLQCLPQQCWWKHPNGRPHPCGQSRYGAAGIGLEPEPVRPLMRCGDVSFASEFASTDAFAADRLVMPPMKVIITALSRRVPHAERRSSRCWILSSCSTSSTNSTLEAAAANMSPKNRGLMNFFGFGDRTLALYLENAGDFLGSRHGAR
jgi:hypothetical protein